MANFATARPTAATPLPPVGTVVWAPDRYHGNRRPHLVVATAPGMVYLAELTHTRQGGWDTTELPTRDHDHSYLALADFRTGGWLPRWVPVADTDTHRAQLQPATAAGAVAYVDACRRQRG